MPDKTMVRAFLNQMEEIEMNKLKTVLRETILRLRPENGAVLIQNLTINVYYASGGGATINVKEDGDVRV